MSYQRGAMGNGNEGSRTSTAHRAESVGAGSDFAPTYLDALKHYVGLGDSLRLAHRLEVTEEKVQQVLQDAAIGGAIGGVIPGLGEIGLSEAIGSYIGGIYGAFDQFGGDVADAIHDVTALLNPEHFSSSDYDRMRYQCIRAGGVPNPGHAPDNEFGCIFSDGTTSGGDYPRHPPPGVQSIRGDNPIPGMPPGMCPGPFGVPIPCQALPPAPKPVYHASRRAMLVTHHGPAPMPSPAAIAAAKVPAPKIVHFSTRIQIRPDVMAHATNVVAAAANGDATAAGAIRDMVDGARAGDPASLAGARILTAAQRMLIRSEFVREYLNRQPPINVGAFYVTGAGALQSCRCSNCQ